jgi:hypothetical protein
MVNQGMKREIMEKRKKIAGILSQISHTQHIRQDTTGLGDKMFEYIN